MTLKVLQILRLKLIPTQLSRSTIHISISLALVHLHFADTTPISYVWYINTL